MQCRGFATIIFLASFCMAYVAQAAPPPRQILPLSQGWEFQQGNRADLPIAMDYDSATWQRVSVPHSWNRIGEYQVQRSASTNNCQGAGWYRLKIETPKAQPRDRHILQFDGVGTVADVWLNGTYVGRHRGGYSAFRFDVTQFVSRSGPNILVVKADNSKPAPGSVTEDVLPLSGDFFPYGGLYRAVSWIVAPAVQIDLLDHAGPGVYLSTLRADANFAQVRILTRLRNVQPRGQRVHLVTEVCDQKGVKARVQSPRQRLAGAATAKVEQFVTIAQPRLWRGREDPFLYTVSVELRAGTQILDRVEQPLGIRTYRFDANQGFFLNGTHVALHGVSRHQDLMGKGAALFMGELGLEYV